MHEVITIFVSNDSIVTKFIVQEEFACHYSPVLKAAFNSGFIEGQTQTYRLEDTTEGAVQMLVKWICTQRLNVLEFDEMIDGNPRSPCIASLWVLADKLLIPRLQNAAMSGLFQLRRHTKVVPTHALRYVFENTPQGSPLHRFILHQCAA
jgi:hypothetical protein